MAYASDLYDIPAMHRGQGSLEHTRSVRGDSLCYRLNFTLAEDKLGLMKRDVFVTLSVAIPAFPYKGQN